MRRPTATANSANCDGAADGLTNQASYTGSASPYGTFDLGGERGFGSSSGFESLDATPER